MGTFYTLYWPGIRPSYFQLPIYFHINLKIHKKYLNFEDPKKIFEPTDFFDFFDFNPLRYHTNRKYEQKITVFLVNIFDQNGEGWFTNPNHARISVIVGCSGMGKSLIDVNVSLDGVYFSQPTWYPANSTSLQQNWNFFSDSVILATAHVASKWNVWKNYLRCLDHEEDSHQQLFLCVEYRLCSHRTDGYMRHWMSLILAVIVKISLYLPLLS